MVVRVGACNVGLSVDAFGSPAERTAARKVENDDKLKNHFETIIQFRVYVKISV